MTYWNAALLGLVQGLAEFLPISSSGHLAVLQNFLAIGDMENHMLFDVLLHLGTLAAVVLAFWKDVREVVTEFLRMLHLRRTPRGLKPNRRERRLISFLILATLPLIPAAFLSNVVESLYQNTFFIGFAFVMTGFLLFAADRMGHGNKDERSSTSADAIVVGLAQAVAVVPGLSRSGTTISAGMLRGFERSFAVKFSFLLSIPAVVGANLVSIIKVFSTGVEWSYVPMYLVGVVCAFVSGYFAIYFLRLIVQRGKFGGFCYYCWGAGLVTLLLSLIS